ncbi:uncharacterized protein F5147DRAFT_781021 [Suillus discolor]|uniref:Uncharacterized protein n=1 Tax=Suillus discolor TaxID=1912936 RepID=A0A9P7EU12_9AGAM|nr:uncharacterized protein F5147DRAFT_781021 [Suillus discolor]KAG2088383.1 hypothetical protein F5147DRAFT_781021 [Suillus discolor]
MARTKQTAPKSTGGLAPRKNGPKFQTPGSVGKRHTTPPQILQEMVQSRLEIHSGPPHNDFCLICQDGTPSNGKDSLYACEESGCPRVMCTRCMLLPASHLHLIEQPGVKFRCLHCHTLLDKRSGDLTPFYGFFKDGSPVLPSFLPIVGPLQLSKRSQISARPVLVIHFKLVGFEATASPIDAVNLYLSSFFVNGGLRFIEVTFDLGTDAKIMAYSQQYEKLANDVMDDCDYQTVCIAITDHTDDTAGDPFLGYSHGSSYVAATVPDFMNSLLGPWGQVIQRAESTTLFFLGCGAIVTQPEGFRGLRSSVVDHTFSHAVAFTAKHFHPCLASHFLISFAQAVIVEGFALREAFPNMLDQSGLGMHTDVLLMTATPEDTVPLRITRYKWAHTSIRPWGNVLPLQCPQCGTPVVWERIQADFSQKYMVFRCPFVGCGRTNTGRGRLSRKKYTCKAPEGSRLLPGRKRNASWLEIDVAFSRNDAETT